MRPSRAGIVAALALSIACKPATVPKTAAGTALRVFELAREADPDPAALEALFGAVGDGDRRAALYDALQRLGRPTGMRVVAAEPLEGLPVTAVDLEGDLPGGGRAHYSVQLESITDESWRVTWFMGPGVDWPKKRRGRGTGLSTSTPPTGPGSK